VACPVSLTLNSMIGYNVSKVVMFKFIYLFKHNLRNNIVQCMLQVVLHGRIMYYKSVVSDNLQLCNYIKNAFKSTLTFSEFKLIPC